MREPIGISTSEAMSSQLQEEGHVALDNTIDKRMKRLIQRIIAKHGLDDSEWAQAISSQYFLLCIAKQLKLNRADYSNLLDKCLSSFRVTYKGEYIIDDERLLITPDETRRIVECMLNEDEKDDYYIHSSKTKAANIDPQTMYFNYHYGLLVRIVSLEDTELLRTIKHLCLDYLTSDDSVDTSDGWYPYRVPWITARILISLRNLNYQSYSQIDRLERIIGGALESLYQRIDEKTPCWRSGVGDWVSELESTGLCLEALYEWNDIRSAEVEEIVKHYCTHIGKSWLTDDLNFSNEESSNALLASVILASVLRRITFKYFPDLYREIKDVTNAYFCKILKMIDKQDWSDNVRQYCTVPQILHYILSAYDLD